MVQSQSFLTNDIEILFSGWQHAIVDSIRMANDQAKWSALFVGDVGGHLLAGFGRACQISAHFIEGGSQFA